MRLELPCMFLATITSLLEGPGRMDSLGQDLRRGSMLGEIDSTQNTASRAWEKDGGYFGLLLRPYD